MTINAIESLRIHGTADGILYNARDLRVTAIYIVFTFNAHSGSYTLIEINLDEN